MTNQVFSIYNVQKNSWYSPKEIINRFEQVRSVYGNRIYDSVFKKAHEMFAGAVALLGAYELSPENKYFMQLNTQSSSPDIIAAKQTEQGKAGILLEINQMEITEFENHFKSDDIIEFLKSTKLSPKKDYGDKVMIICIINKKIPFDHRKIHKALIEIKPKSTIYIIGRPIDAEMGNFTICTPYPRLTKPLNFNVDATAAKYTIPERVTFNLGIDEKISCKRALLESVNTYEIFGLDRDRIYKKYKAFATIKA